MSSEHLLRAHLAPEPRTLVDIVRATAAAYPEAAAIDDGEVLTYSAVSYTHLTLPTNREV